MVKRTQYLVNPSLEETCPNLNLLLTIISKFAW